MSSSCSRERRAVERLLVDGGPTRNDQLMQFEADMVGAPVERTSVAELSAMGVAHLAASTATCHPEPWSNDRERECSVPGATSRQCAPRRGGWYAVVARGGRPVRRSTTSARHHASATLRGAASESRLASGDASMRMTYYFCTTYRELVEPHDRINVDQRIKRNAGEEHADRRGEPPKMSVPSDRRHPDRRRNGWPISSNVRPT